MRNWCIIITSMALAVSCRGGKPDQGKAAALLAGFREWGDEAPGHDAFSSSTNRFEREEVQFPKLDPLAGAAYVKPPAIGNYGTVELAYPVETPAGRAGMAPSIALSYSSSSGDGVAGIGWGLSTGLGVISRDTGRGELRYDHRDTFTYNGKRLLKVKGAPGSQNGTYRLEIESGFSRFELTGSEEGGIWRVYDTSGVVTIYGESDDTRIAHPDGVERVYLWNFSRSVDRNGNTMTASYVRSPTSHSSPPYLSEIRYTGNDTEGMMPRQWVRFTYQKRRESYVTRSPGFLIVMDQLLDEVIVGWDSKELWRYTCVYRESEDSARPLLVTVRSSKTSTEPEFIYGKGEHYLVWRNVANPRVSDPSEAPGDVRHFEGDFNGDGLSDMMFYNPVNGDWSALEALPAWAGGGYAHRRYGTAFGGVPVEWFPGGATGDYNGDGRSDIAFYLPATGEIWTALHNGRTFDFRRYGRMDKRINLAACEWFTGDFDGNGLSDVVLFNEPTGEWLFMKNRGDYFEILALGRRFRHLFRDDYRPDASMNGKGTSDENQSGRDRSRVHFLCGDYNGDGRSDVSLHDDRTGEWWVGENRFDDDPSGPGFVLDWYRYGRFTAPEQALFGHDRFSGDFNGDGRSDFICYDREEGRWWIGETGDRSIAFRVFAGSPRSREITRWIQGDFNGDGRTDIGFYSADGGDFWIGEADPFGFRFRVYTSLRECPDPERILAAPLPCDEVVLKKGRGLAGLTPVRYHYDGNEHRERGEAVFVGHFASAPGDAPELLIYDRSMGRFSFKKGSADPLPVLESDGLNIVGGRIMNNGRPRRYRGNDGLLYYRPHEGVFGAKRHIFSLVCHDGVGFVDEEIASFGEDLVEEFDIGSGLFWIDRFKIDDTDEYLLALDDGSDDPAFLLFGTNGESSEARRIVIDAGALRDQFFRGLRGSGVRIFSGDYTRDGTADLLMVDYRDSVHRWYLGTLSSDGGRISFAVLSGNPRFYPEGFIASRGPAGGGDGAFLYVTNSSGRFCFHRLRVESGAITVLGDDTLQEGVEFNADFDAAGRPLVYVPPAESQGPVPKWVVFQGGGYRFEDTEPERSIDRPDLMTRVYPFQWLQGDYNGDGKTDIGFFHLKERNWYFALSGGVTPDLLTGVKNGIGGRYDFEYVNSSGLDNTGDDDVADLPVNYRVCARMIVEDGLGRSVTTSYEYRNGSAFSDFIKGRKETDYFGFGEFSVIDAYGARTVHRHHGTPFDDFRMNRALGGARKETRRIGSDNIEYERMEYDYRVMAIEPSSVPDGAVQSFLLEPSAVRRYARDVLTETRETMIEFMPGRYEIRARHESTTDHYRDGAHEPVSVRSVFEYESVEATNQARLAIKTEFEGTHLERVTEFLYDARGNCIRERTRPGGARGSSVAERVMEYAYNGYGNRIHEADASGSPARITEREYDGELSQYVVEERARGGGIALVTRYSIDYGSAFGAVTEKRGPDGNAVGFEYDGLGRLIREWVDADAPRETLGVYDYTAGFPLSVKATRFAGGGITGPSEAMELRVYADGMGRVIHTVRSASDTPGRRYVKSGLIVYDRAGREVRKSRPDYARDEEINAFVASWRENNPTVTEYDGSGRPGRVTLPRAHAGESETFLVYVYDDPWMVTETHSAGRVKRTVRNGRGFVLYVEDSGTGPSKGSGDGAFVRAKIGFAYDDAGNRVKKMDIAPGGPEMTTDIPGDLFRPGVMDRSGAAIACWRYDAFGRLLAESDPDRGYTGHAYNAFGDLVMKTDGNGATTIFRYDSLGRLEEKVLPGDEGTVRYAYDRAPGSENAMGRPVRIESPTQTKQFSYDRMGRVGKETRVMTGEEGLYGGTYVTRIRHDLLGRKTEISYPKDPLTGKDVSVRYRHDPMGVRSVEVDDGESWRAVVELIEYGETGRVREVRRGNGTVSYYAYDGRDRLASLLTTAAHNGREWRVQDVRFEYYDDDAIAEIENTPDVGADGPTMSTIRYEYAYDGLNRLVHARGTYQKTATTPGADPLAPGLNPGLTKNFDLGYEYAPNGNMMGRTLYDPESAAIRDSRRYRYRNHAVTAVDTMQAGGAIEMRYDGAGNMVERRDGAADRAMAMDYDSTGRINRVIDPDSGEVIGRYRYDESGYRVRKRARRLVEGEERVVETVSPSMYLTMEGQKTIDGRPISGTHSAVRHVYLNGVRIAALGPGGETRHYLTDQVDSVTVVTDDAGRVLSSQEYLPFGEAWVAEGDEGNAPKYNSQEFDRETGYYYYNARHYDPALARFVTPDSVVDGQFSTQGWNRYSYCHNNPIIYRDPAGHDIRDSIWIFADAAGENIRSFGEGIRSVGEKLAQPLWNAREWDDAIIKGINDKLQQAKDAGNRLETNIIIECESSAYKFVRLYTGENIVQYTERDHKTAEYGRYMKVRDNKDGIDKAITGLNPNGPLFRHKEQLDKFTAKLSPLGEMGAAAGSLLDDTINTAKSLLLSAVGEDTKHMKILDNKYLHSTAVAHDEALLLNKNASFFGSMFPCFIVGKTVEHYLEKNIDKK